MGLTRGAFYARFRSKDALVAEAIALAANQTIRSLAGEDASCEKRKRWLELWILFEQRSHEIS